MSQAACDREHLGPGLYSRSAMAGGPRTLPTDAATRSGPCVEPSSFRTLRFRHEQRLLWLSNRQRLECQARCGQCKYPSWRSSAGQQSLRLSGLLELCLGNLETLESTVPSFTVAALPQLDRGTFEGWMRFLCSTFLDLVVRDSLIPPRTFCPHYCQSFGNRGSKHPTSLWRRRRGRS